ncbi:MAG: hypothetical protein Q7S21_01855 [archaeon]|nr:hypothetical protein [archaeon]
MNVNLKTLGYLLVGFSIILLFILAMIKINYDTTSAQLCDLQDHENTGTSMLECPAHTGNESWIILLGFGIAFLILGIGIYMLFIAKPEELEFATKKDFAQVDLTQLDEEEKKIYETIKNKGGSAYQSDLITLTDFSKVKITRILDKLESKGILERKRRGMTNIIVLK